MLNSIEKHHIDRKKTPNVTVKIFRKEHQKLHNNLPIDTPLSKKMRHYEILSKLIKVTKSWSVSYEKEYGEKTEIDISNLKKAKVKIRNEIVQMIAKERLKISSENRFQNILLAKILAYAHPTRFPSCRKFLHYCGYTESAKMSKKYRRDVHSAGYEIVKYLIMAKDKKYYPVYLMIKNQMRTKHPDDSKAKIDGITRNRVGTLVFKEIYLGIWGRKGAEVFIKDQATQ